jgi:hypothetical protein
VDEVTVVMFHTNHCNLNTCDGGCLYHDLPLCDVPIPTTDKALGQQWTAALDYAERMGAQTAQMLAEVSTAWQAHKHMGSSWRMFLNQFDVETWHLLKDAYRDGFDSVYYRIITARGIR